MSEYQNCICCGLHNWHGCKYIINFVIIGVVFIAALDPDSKVYSHHDTIRAAMVQGFLMAQDEMTQVDEG